VVQRDVMELMVELTTREGHRRAADQPRLCRWWRATPSRMIVMEQGEIVEQG
jgi:hypothetical protein